MSPLFRKLNFKDQSAIHVINAPASLQSELDEMRAAAEIRTAFSANKDVVFALAFATKQAEVDRLAAEIDATSIGDAIIWVAYPKGTSKRYSCDFNRDTGWQSFGAAGFEPVRQVAIDEDWSALRFRRVDYIKTMKRDFAITEAGKEKVKESRSKS